MENKISWDDAPEWANYYATDNDGFSYWYARKPHLVSLAWAVEKGLICRNLPVIKSWKDPLQSRPKKK